jgi:hypothetical protein
MEMRKRSSWNGGVQQMQIVKAYLSLFSRDALNSRKTDYHRYALERTRSSSEARSPHLPSLQLNSSCSLDPRRVDNGQGDPVQIKPYGIWADAWFVVLLWAVQ